MLLQDASPSVIVLPQPGELADLPDSLHGLHGLHGAPSDGLPEDDASSSGSTASSSLGSTEGSTQGSTECSTQGSTQGSTECRRFYRNLRLEVNERLLTSSDEDEGTGPSRTRPQRARKRRRKGGCALYILRGGGCISDV